MAEIMVSVICNAYNHEKYIADALDGFVMQKANFNFEVLVHDDASTDRTAEIIKEYESKYPDIIKPIYQTENQYSKGIKISMVYNYPRVQGKYIALCEGDDYWTDPLKLQKQYDAMEKHPEVDICAHEARMVKANTKEFIRYISPSKNDCVLTTEQVIAGGGGYVATNSLFFRTELIRNIPEFRKMLSLDYTMQIQGALRGGMLYLNDCMSAYRSMVDNSWTVRMKEPSKYFLHRQKVNLMFKALDEHTKGMYKKAIRKVNEKSWESLYNNLSDIREEPYYTTYKQFPVALKIKIRLKRFVKNHCRVLVKVIKKLSRV